MVQAARSVSVGQSITAAWGEHPQCSLSDGAGARMLPLHPDVKKSLRRLADSWDQSRPMAIAPSDGGNGTANHSAATGYRYVAVAAAIDNAKEQ